MGAEVCLIVMPMTMVVRVVLSLSIASEMTKAATANNADCNQNNSEQEAVHCPAVLRELR